MALTNKSSHMECGYGNGGIEPMGQFNKLSEKISNSLKNLEFTRDMLRQLAENERKSAKAIATILNQKNKSLRFSVVDQAIQNYWKKQESNRRHFSDALQSKIVDELDAYISGARERKKKLCKENGKIQRSFIECKKETIKLAQIGLKEWQKLEEQISKNDQHKKTNKLQKVKDLKSLQDRCSKAFAKYESYIAKLNALEQSNHEQSCQIGTLLHESQKYASDRLQMHYNIAVSYKKVMDEFIRQNRSIVQSAAPPLGDILWRWLSFPRNHINPLPCTSAEVFTKHQIGQQFKRRVEPDFQPSKHLKSPYSSKESKLIPKTKKKKEIIPIPKIQKKKEIKFDDDFGDFANFDDTNADLEIANQNESNNGNGNGHTNFADNDWNTNFEDDTFGNNKEEQTANANVDALFAVSEANDIFGSNNTDMFGNETKTDNDIFGNEDKNESDIFGNENENDIFGNENKNENEDESDIFGNETKTDNDIFGNENINESLFDDEFDDGEEELQFPEFDLNTENQNSHKPKPKPKPKPVSEDDNPFGENTQIDDIDDIDAENPFAMFDEPDNIAANDNNEDDPFAL